MISSRKQFKILHDQLLLEKPQLAAAVIWLQGDRYDRAPKVLSLYKKSWVQKIIISGNDLLIGPKIRPGENNISLAKMKDFLLKKGVPKQDIIVDQGAMNTKEQAAHILKLAKTKKWSKLILVGSSYYQPRAFLTFLKQAQKMKWLGLIINQSAFIRADRKPAGRDKTVKVLLNEEFTKLSVYKKDVATISQGIKYLRRKASLRKVEKGDIELLFKWVNDPVVRVNARNSKPVTRQRHSAWFAEKLNSPATYMYILTEFGQNVGIIRFDKKDNKFVISYSIDKLYRGRGLGELIIAEGLKKISSITRRPHFIAQVKLGNIASEKIFNKLGFILIGEERVNNVKFNIYQK